MCKDAYETDVSTVHCGRQYRVAAFAEARSPQLTIGVSQV